jgi:arylsulfatase A-like enzyme
LGEKQQWRKFTLWERSCRVVMSITAPGVSKANGQCDRTVELLDIYPTLIDLCGLPKKPELQGQSLKPLLANPSAPWDKPALTDDGPDKASVRTEQYRYSRFPDGEELYDHTKDPNEWHNLAGDPKLVGQKQALAKYLPRNPNRKKPRNWAKLTDQEKKLIKFEGDRHPLPDAQNDIGLKSTID